MDLVPTDGHAGQAAPEPVDHAAGAVHLAQRLGRVERCIERQQPEPWRAVEVAFDAKRVAHRLAQHLHPAADPEHRRAVRGAAT